MVIQESGQMYLEAIYVLSLKSNGVHAVDVGEYLGFSKPSVSRALSILKEKKLITVDGNSHIFFTDEGRKIAEDVYNRHVVIKECLLKLGVSDGAAESDACKLEHVLSEESFNAIKNHLNKFKDENKR